METKKGTKNDSTYKFKSYYVVWKQKIQFVVPGSTSSLNRTMQYGNCKYAY